MPKSNLVGLRFGKLVVVQPTDKRDSSESVVWECRCDCGNTTFVSARRLNSGNTKSCGCLKRELVSKMRLSDLAGQRFGKLTAVRPTDKRQEGSVVWECKCDCGNTSFVTAASLKSGNTKSCGCLKRELASISIRNVISVDTVDGTKLSSLSSKISNNNSSGVRGVSYHKSSGKWVAYIMFQSRMYHLGSYDEMAVAVEARKRAEHVLWDPLLEEYLGSFANEQERTERLIQYFKENLKLLKESQEE